MVRLVSFRAEHLMMFVHRDNDYVESLQSAREKERLGPAFTALIADKVAGCAGIQLMWSGFGIAWATLSKELLDQYPIWTTRTVRRVLRDTIRAFHLHRVEMVVLSNHEMNARWAELFGFTKEVDGIAMQYTASKDDVHRYEFIVEER